MSRMKIPAAWLALGTVTVTRVVVVLSATLNRNLFIRWLLYEPIVVDHVSLVLTGMLPLEVQRVPRWSVWIRLFQLTVEDGLSQQLRTVRSMHPSAFIASEVPV